MHFYGISPKKRFNLDIDYMYSLKLIHEHDQFIRPSCVYILPRASIEMLDAIFACPAAS
jgi:hypothetical protein